MSGDSSGSFLSWIWDYEPSLSCACAFLLTVLTDCRWLRDDVRPLWGRRSAGGGGGISYTVLAHRFLIISLDFVTFRWIISLDFINFHQFISLDYFFLCNFAPKNSIASGSQTGRQIYRRQASRWAVWKLCRDQSRTWTAVEEPPGRVPVSSHAINHAFTDSCQSLQLTQWCSFTLQFY